MNATPIIIIVNNVVFISISIEQLSERVNYFFTFRDTNKGVNKSIGTKI